MKRLMKTFVLVAAAAMALTSCENEVMDSVQENDTYTLTFVADAPEGTRTSVSINGDEATFAWSENGEYLKFLQYTETKTTLYQQKSAEGVVATDGSATFSVTFTNEIDGATEYYYSAIYPERNVVDKGSVNAVEAKVPAEQTLTAGSYDPNADLMVAKPVGPVAYTSNAIYSLQFHRLAAVGRMNIKGIEDGEKIYKVVFTLADGTKFAGNAFVNLEGDGTDVAFLGEDSGSANAITLNSNGDYVAANAGTFVYFTCLPLTYTGSYTLEVETDAATYINTGKSISNPISFTAGDVTGFNISAGERTEKSESNAAWVKVNDLSELTEGTKIALVGTTNSASYSMKTNAATSAPTVVSVSFDGDNLAESSINGISTFVVGVDGSNYILYGDDTKTDWLYCFSNNNGVRFGTNSNNTFAIAAHTNNGSNWQIKHVGTSRFVGIYNNQDWRCYTTVNASNFTDGKGTSDIAIYRYSEDGTSTPALKERNLAFNPTAVTLTYGDNFVAPKLEGVTDGILSYTSSNTTVATVTNGGVVAIVGVGTTTITVRAEANETYKAGEASYTITVNAVQSGEGDGGEIVATFEPGRISANNTTVADDKNNSWVITTDATYFGTTKDYIQVGSNKTQVSHLTLTSPIENVKSVTVYAAAKASSNATINVYIGSTLIGTSEVLGNTASSGGTAFTVENTANVSGALTIKVSRPNSASGALYFNSATITYAE